MLRKLISAIVILTCGHIGQAQDLKFETKILDPHVGEICYALTLADVNGDRKEDIVAVTEDAVVYFENPTWTKHVLIKGKTVRDNVCIAANDIDADGQVDFALGAGWTKTGTLQWIGRDKSGTWQVHPISSEVWLHRIRWGDVLGTGRSQLVVSPLNKTVGDGVRILAFEIPKDPSKDAWNVQLLNHELNRVHNHWIVDLDSNGSKDVITASAEGVSVLNRKDDGWRRTLVSGGAPGAGEVKSGRFGERAMLACIEPMHGTHAVVYVKSTSGRSEISWRRVVLDGTLKRGHAIWLADLNRDGRDEVIVGHSEPGAGKIIGPGVYYYASNQDGSKWSKHVLDDGGMATEDILAADLDGDGWIDVVAGGRNTHNVKLYRNLGR